MARTHTVFLLNQKPCEGSPCAHRAWCRDGQGFEEKTNKLSRAKKATCPRQYSLCLKSPPPTPTLSTALNFLPAKVSHLLSSFFSHSIPEGHFRCRVGPQVLSGEKCLSGHIGVARVSLGTGRLPGNKPDPRLGAAPGSFPILLLYQMKNVPLKNYR